MYLMFMDTTGLYILNYLFFYLLLQHVHVCILKVPYLKTFLQESLFFLYKTYIVHLKLKIL